MATLKSPRPTPKFFFEEKTFSSKKERGTPKVGPPPKPPGKTVPAVSRFFSCTDSQRAHLVSFRESDSSLNSKCYNESNKLPYFDQCFEVVCKLGSGSFADVFKVKSKEDGRYYAIKRSKEKFKGKCDRERKLKEVQKHEHLTKHQNCIGFYKAWEEKQYLYMQTELCECSLSQYSEKNHDIPEYIIWNYLVDLLLAVKNLHDHNLVHLDIKPANIFITEDGICKLGDFGLVLDLSKDDFSDAAEGDPKYLAAELMEGKFTKAADIFSLGITILELACDLDLPRGGDAWHQLREGKIPCEFRSRISSDLADIIESMMEPDYTRRPSVHDVLRRSSIRKVYHKRMFTLKMKYMASYFMFVYNCITFCFLYIKTALLNPYNTLHGSQKSITPPPLKYCHPLEWDYSFSDEDVFEDDLKVLGTSFSDSPPDDNRNISYILPDIRKRVVCSTPAALRYWKTRASGSCSPTCRWKRSSPTANSSPGVLKHSPLTSSAVKIVDSNCNQLNIGPRNLMEAFDAESSDD